MFKLTTDFRPTTDQERAIRELTKGISLGYKDQTLLGVTGSGKTYAMASVIEKTKFPTLIISHNKTLAGQLYQEMKGFFPENAVSYFVSYYDFYQPEAYIPSTDTYIEKEAQINDLIDKLRLQATTNLLTRDDVVIVSSVSSIYNIGSPEDYKKFMFELKIGDKIDRKRMFIRLSELQYIRSEFDFKRGSFRVRGSEIDIYPAYEDLGYRLSFQNDTLYKIVSFDPLTGIRKSLQINTLVIYPAKQYMTDLETFNKVENLIKKDLDIEFNELKKEGKDIEAKRLMQKVNYDLEMIKEVGYVNGIENYSRYFDNRKPGESPKTLLDYFKYKFKDDWIVMIDESHMTIPQLNGMYNGDHSRKKNLIEYGFRLKASIDNRPLKFDEFYRYVPRLLYVSATPGPWEYDRSEHIVEILTRPTGIIDPKVIIRDSKNEVEDLEREINKHVSQGNRVLVTTLTKCMAEDLTSFLKNKGINAEYLHSDIKTLDRSATLTKLRKKEYDVLVGINLLREGLDLPEVSLVAILDADKEGFLRSKTSLIQLMGRASRHVSGEVIIYADSITGSIKGALEEVERRRSYQLAYNKKHNISPSTISKPIREELVVQVEDDEDLYFINEPLKKYLDNLDDNKLTPFDRKRLIKKLSKDMKRFASEMKFEQAIMVRDKIRSLKNN